MDILTDVFSTLDLKGVLYFRSDFSPPWAVDVPNRADAARFHLVVQGKCYVILPTGKSLALGPGDLILLPKGKSHILADQITYKALVTIKNIFSIPLVFSYSIMVRNSDIASHLRMNDINAMVSASCLDSLTKDNSRSLSRFHEVKMWYGTARGNAFKTRS